MAKKRKRKTKKKKEKEIMGISILQIKIVIPIMVLLTLVMLPTIISFVVVMSVFPIGGAGALFGVICFITSPYWIVFIMRSVNNGNIAPDKKGRMRWKNRRK